MKAKIGDTTFSGQYAQAAGIAFQEFWSNWIYNLWVRWTYSKLTYWQDHYRYGYTLLIGSDIKKFGSTSLLVYKYKFVPYKTIPKEYQWIIEGWIAPTQFGGILVYLYVESLDHKEWFKWELISITLSEQLKLPNVHFSGSSYNGGCNILYENKKVAAIFPSFLLQGS